MDCGYLGGSLDPLLTPIYRSYCKHQQYILEEFYNSNTMLMGGSRFDKGQNSMDSPLLPILAGYYDVKYGRWFVDSIVGGGGKSFLKSNKGRDSGTWDIGTRSKKHIPCKVCGKPIFSAPGAYTLQHFTFTLHSSKGSCSLIPDIDLFDDIPNIDLFDNISNISLFDDILDIGLFNDISFKNLQTEGCKKKSI
ncbi:hypothetical protein Glove_517g9 [Diversispora epigaea]|uniref:Uncharacterized protein n=1 Tax=Diversispora epigaea TaxID=1348612 RepID=A0A397GHS2_9GLOM|nr:hypothetical protein Glove_517g9 [Diversispora epigaea]